MKSQSIRSVLILALSFVAMVTAVTGASAQNSTPPAASVPSATPAPNLSAPAATPLDPNKSAAIPLTKTPDAGASSLSPSVPTPPAAETDQPGAPAQDVTSLRAANDQRYRIGAGDVLEIRVMDRPTLSREAIRVDASGLIRMPMIRHDIPVICKTEAEISDAIAKEYSEYLKDPQVSVFVKEFNAEPVSLVGAVQKPGGYQLQRRIRLRELLMIAGGPGTTAGGVVQIMHDDSAGACDTEDPQHRIMSLETPDVTLLKLEDVMHANPASNPFVRPGDFINLPEANQAYVVGNVFKPSSIALNGTITISRAIAMAGGTLPNSKGRIRLLRLMPDQTGNREIFLDLKSLQRNTSEDIALMAGDIVEVPLSEGKLIAKSIFTSVATGALLYYPMIIVR